MIRMILDVDTGIDDAIALSYALCHPDIDLLGITTTYGNVVIDTAVENTLAIVDLFERTVPVYRGSSHPLTKDNYVLNSAAYRVHGYNGIGNVPLKPRVSREQETDAVDFLLESAREYGKDLTLVCVGPLTNLARAIQKDKDAMLSAGRVVIMGGALSVRGNVSVNAEANFHADPYAADLVFSSGLHLDMIGLDVTWQALITHGDLAELKSAGTYKSDALCEMCEYYYRNEFTDGTGAGALHDPLAVEAAAYPDIITQWYSCNLRVLTDEASYGRVTGNKELLNDPEKHVRVALALDRDLFLKQLMHRLKALCMK